VLIKFKWVHQMIESKPQSASILINCNEILSCNEQDLITVYFQREQISGSATL